MVALISVFPLPLQQLVCWPIDKLRGCKKTDAAPMIRAAIRIALLVGVLSLLPKFTGSLAVAGVLGCLVSAPVVFLTGGAMLAQAGFVALKVAVALGSFSSMFQGLALGFGAYVAWNGYETIPEAIGISGLLEGAVIVPLADTIAGKK